MGQEISDPTFVGFLLKSLFPCQRKMTHHVKRADLSISPFYRYLAFYP
jgi:hypothetical protein